jgi:hypothetical protein
MVNGAFTKLFDPAEIAGRYGQYFLYAPRRPTGEIT